MGALKISARDIAQTCTWLTYQPICNINGQEASLFQMVKNHGIGT